MVVLLKYLTIMEIGHALDDTHLYKRAPSGVHLCAPHQKRVAAKICK